MSRDDAPGFGPCIRDQNCWECNHADCINRYCYKYDFEFVEGEALSNYKCDSFEEI